MRYIDNVVTLALDAEKCIGCRKCEQVCPHAVFEVRERKAFLQDKNACMECGACALNCPTQAVTVQQEVGCAQAIIRGFLTGTAPNCDCACEKDSQTTQRMNQPNAFFATLAGILSSGLVVLGMVTCCGMPLVAGILAAVGVGASQLSFLAKYQGMFIGIAIASLMFGFYQAYFAKKSSCCGGATPKQSRFLQCQKIFLWIGAAIVGAVIVFSMNDNNTDLDNIDAGSSCCPTSTGDNQ